MRFKTTIGQVAVVGGRRYDRVEGILVDERTSRFARGRGQSNLYVLVEMEGQVGGREVVAERLANIVRDTYFKQRRSVTAGLQQAVRAANSFLFEENWNSLPDERRTAGVSCAVLRGEDLFVAQAGPAALYVSHKDRAIRFPEISPWLDSVPMSEVDAAPLGTRPEVHVDLFHSRLNEGDTVLVVDSGLARHVHPRAWYDILTAAPLPAVLQQLLVEGKGGDLWALAVRLGEADVLEAASQPAASVGALVSAPAQQQAAQQKEQRRKGKRTVAAAGGLAGLWAALLTFLKRLVPGQTGPHQVQRKPTSPEKRPQERRRKPRRTETMRAPGSPRLQKVLIAVAVAIPLVVAALVAVTVIQRDRAQKAELEELWQGANSLWMQAGETDDSLVARPLLLEAEENLEKLLARRPDHPGALDLQRRVKARLDEGNQVRRVNWEGKLMTYPENASLTRVVVQGVDVFVLDRSADIVYHHRLDEFQQALEPETQDRVLVRKGEQVGDILVGDLVDMVWMPVGSGRQKAGLVILEGSGSLLEYDPGTKSLTSSRLGMTDAWQLPHLVGSHSGRLYVLDLGANRIWRYGPTPDGYSSPPDEWLQTNIDLAGVRDMAVGDSIYLLYADGTIQKLTGGNPDAFDLSDWDAPPVGPTAIFTRPPNETQWVYVADAGNSRIVRSSKEGKLGGQFRLADSQIVGSEDPLANVSSLFVDEIGGRAYFPSDNSLYVIVLPEE